MKNLIIILSCLVCTVSCSLLDSKPVEKLKIKGSYTMNALVDHWAVAYMEAHENASVYVDGGGTTTGFEAMLKGEADIAMASRLIRTEEASRFASKYGRIGLSFLVAKDALSIYVDPTNPVNNLTIGQLNRIFSGEISNWKEVGGYDRPIQCVLRPPTSGTHLYFKEYVLENKNYRFDAQILPTNRAIMDYINENVNAIGFGGITHLKEIKQISVEGIEAIESNVHNESYPLVRYLYLYTIDKPSGVTKRFIDFVLSPVGQSIVEQSGFIALWPQSVQDME